MSLPKFPELIGTLTSYFKLGKSGVQIKDNSGNLLIRNNADTADASVTASLVNVSGDSVIINSDAAGTGTDYTLTLARSGSQSSAYTLTLPPTAGSAGQVLGQTGSGVTTWVTVGGTADKITTDTTNLAFGSGATVSLFTLPANAVVEAVRVIVDTVFNGSPSLSIGVSGTTSKYMASTQVDLKVAAIFEVYPGIIPVGTTEALIATYSAGSATAGAARIEIDYVVPS